MKFTQYFLHTRERPDRQGIKVEWIEQVFYNPELRLCWCFHQQATVRVVGENTNKGSKEKVVKVVAKELVEV